MDILAEYQRAEWLAIETLTLAPDRVTSRSAFRYWEQFQTIRSYPLRGVSAMPVVTRSRSPGFVFGLLLFAGSLWMACVWIFSGGSRSGFPLPPEMAICAFGGLVWALCCSRRWYAVRFYTDIGTLAFTVRCPREDESELDGFVASVVRQIRAINPAG